MSAERRRSVLIGVLAIFAVVAAWRYLGSPAPADPVAAAARRAAAAEVPVPPVDVQLDALDASRQAPAEGARNLFVFGARAVTSAPARGPSPGIVFEPVPLAGPTGPPPLPPIPFKFIGLVEGASGGRIAVLSDSRGLVVHGTEGAIIDGRFRILSIGPESIDLAYTDGRGRQTLRLSGQ
jgi:hypothetical protein